MATVEVDVLQILINCGCSQHAMKFAGLTKEKFFLYTRDDLVRILPPVDGVEDLSQKIENEIEKAKANKESGQDEDDDLKILEIVIRKEGTQVTVKEEVVDDDDEGDQDTSGPPAPMEEINLDNDDEDDSTSAMVEEGSWENTSSEDSSDECEPIELNPMDPTSGFQKLENENKAAVIITGNKRVHKYVRNHPRVEMLPTWTDGLKKWGSHIRSLKMSNWTWENSTSSCPWNLFKILTQLCLFVKELSIEGNISSQAGDQVSQFPANLKLPNLKILRIRHDSGLTYTKQLNQILVAAHKLRSIYVAYGSLGVADSFLEILRDLHGDELKNLKILSIKSFHGSGYLTEAQIVMLAKVEAVSLEELELGDGLWGDVQGSTMERMLRRFSSTLQTLTILGGFQGWSDLKPKILITFPQMVSLKKLKIGSNYAYRAIYEDSLPLNPPPKKIQKGSKGQKINATISGLKAEPFPVSLKFPLLPNLKKLHLGHLFNIKDLHFSSFPKLEAFFVGSRWDLSVVFPPEKTSRRASYPLVVDLQLPDSLDDPNFIKLIPSRFPNLIYCEISLPTVKVLRTFLSVMADSNLEELYLKTRFDFPCTLDTCLQDKPSEMPLVLAEAEKIRLLKEYRHSEEFVKFHKIELPPEELASLEGGELAGISSLKKLTTLTLEHRPRTLRIPQGQLHWTDSQCEFTGEVIGFEDYPWSLSCEILRNKLMTKSLQEDFYLNYDVPFRTTKQPELIENPFSVELSHSTVDVKKEKV